MPNAELAYKILDHIDANPEQWNQQDWISRPIEGDCRTAACFAGWACMLSGDKANWDGLYSPITAYVTPAGLRYEYRVSSRATGLLGLSGEDAQTLFDGTNTRDDLGNYVEKFFGPRPTP